MKNKTRDSSPDRKELEQMNLNFPGLLELLEKKTIDNIIYPSQRKAAALAVHKGMHVVDAGRRKA